MNHYTIIKVHQTLNIVRGADNMIAVLFLVGLCVIGILAYLGMKGTGAL